MQTPTDAPNWEQTLVGYGIEVGLLVSGFFGALMMVSRRGAQRIGTTVASVLAGTACANYLTPVVLHFAPDAINDGRGKFAVAFAMGFLGLKGLEKAIDKLIDPAMEKHSKKPSKKGAKRKSTKPKKRKPRSKK